MIYLEDEYPNDVPTWKPLSGKVADFDVEDLETIEDCEDAADWLHDVITKMHLALEGQTDTFYVKRAKWRIAMVHQKLAHVNRLKAKWLKEEYKDLLLEKVKAKAYAKELARMSREDNLDEKALRNIKQHNEFFEKHKDELYNRPPLNKETLAQEDRYLIAALRELVDRDTFVNAVVNAQNQMREDGIEVRKPYVPKEKKADQSGYE